MLLLLAAVSCSDPAPTQVTEPAAEPTETPDPPETTTVPEPATTESTETPDPPETTAAPEPTTTEPTETPGPPEPATWGPLSIEGSTIVMEGELDDGFYRGFLALVRDREDEITTLRVNSGGGITDEGRKVGAWIFEHDIDVVVDGLCFSSCANYMFPAGRNKTILADSIVGWHGSEQQDEHIARGLGITVRELLGREYDKSVEEWGETPTPEGREDYIEAVLSGNPAAVAEEQAFLEKIGVSVDAMVYGFLPDQFQEYFVKAPDHISGWTFSIEDMASFGIDNVTYAGEGEYPSEQATTDYGVMVLKVP